VSRPKEEKKIIKLQKVSEPKEEETPIDSVEEKGKKQQSQDNQVIADEESSVDLSDDYEPPQKMPNKDEEEKQEAGNEVQEPQPQSQPQEMQEQSQEVEKAEEHLIKDQENEGEQNLENQAVAQEEPQIAEEPQLEKQEIAQEQPMEEPQFNTQEIVEETSEEQGEAELFIGNLPFTVTEAQVREFFAGYGELASVKLLQRVFFKFI
jgi:hypothetical protein